MRLPLPHDYFYSPPLKYEEAQDYLTQGDANATILVQNSTLRSGAVPWVLLSDETDLKIYKAYDLRRRVPMYLSKSTVVGTLEEVMTIFQTHTTDHAKEYTERLGKDLMDAATLYNINTPCNGTSIHNTDITWMAMRGPLLATPRDACLLESRRVFNDKGRRGWVRSLVSVEVDCCPPFPGIVRATLYGSGHVFVESNRPGYIEMSYVSHVYPGTRVPTWLEDLAHKRRCRGLILVDKCLRENRIAYGPIQLKAPTSDDGELITPRTCFLCAKTFGILRAASFCCKCSQILCSFCNPKWDIKVSGMNACVQACVKCAQKRIPYPQDATMLLPALQIDIADQVNNIALIG